MYFPASKFPCLLSAINAGQSKQWVDNANISLANMSEAW